MANLVRNIVKMSKITTLPLFTVELDADGHSVTAFDFNRIIPMPQSLKMEAGTIENLAIEAALRNDAVLRSVLAQMKTIPNIGGLEYWYRIAESDKTEAELSELGRQYIRNLLLYGATT